MVVGDGDLARAIAAAPPGTADAEEAELYRRFAPRVRLFGLRHLRDDAAAQDLVQDVLLRTIERLRAGEVREPDAIASFILGMSRMMSASRRRMARRREALAVQFQQAAQAAESVRDTIDLSAVERCVATLDERERAIVVQSFYAQRTAAEIAGDLGLAGGTVRVIRHRAIARLRACLGFISAS